MKTFKRSIAIIFVVIMALSVIAVGVHAASVSTTTGDYGYMMPTDSKFTKTQSTVKLYGSNDYINFYIDSEYANTYFFYEVYSDKNYTKPVSADYVYCEERGTYTWSPMITLKGVFKSGTYYCITYGAKMDSSGNIKLSTPSVTEFKLVVDRTTAFNKQVVLLKNVKTTVDGPQITWYKHSSAATKYVIYRRSVNGTKWTTVGTVNGSTLTFTDKSVKAKSGKYVYTVKALDKSGTASRYQFSGLSCLFAATPVIKSVAVQSDNQIQVKWNNVSSASYYRVYRKTDGGSWETISNHHTGNTYVDKAIESGKNYEYTVRTYINTAQGVATSAYYSGNKVDYISAPKLNEIKQVDGAINISWQPVNEAVGYSVYRKPLDGSEGWTLLKRVSADVTSYQDATMNLNGAYSYTVRSEGKTFRGSYNGKGLEYYELAKPDFTITTDEMGIHITWEKVPYADSYYIVSRNANGAWQSSTKTTKCSYTYLPKTCSEFTFSVQACRNGVKGQFNKDVETVTYFPVNKITYQVYTGYNKLAWDSVGADQFNLYKKPKSADDSAYELIYSGEGKSFADKSVEYDVAYTYQLRAVYKSIEQTQNFTTINITRYSPERYITSFDVEKSLHKSINGSYTYFGYTYFYNQVLTNSAKGMSNVVYTNTGSGWVNTKSSNSYEVAKGTDDNIAERKFSIMVYDSEGRTPVDAVVCVVEKETCNEIPQPSYEAVKDGLKVSWNAVEGAARYRLEEITDTSFKTTIKADGSSKYSVVIPASKFNSGNTYFYLYAIHSNGNSSRFYDRGVQYCAANPKLQEVSESDKGTIIFWRSPQGYSERHIFHIFRKAPGESSWKIIATNNGGFSEKEKVYYDKTAKKGVKYVYTVRVYDNYSYCYASYFDTKGLSVGELATPTLTSVANSANGMNIKWETIYGANRYYIYRKSANSNWIKIGEVYGVDFEFASHAVYTDKTAKAGVTYTYTVRALDGNTSSSYDKVGLTIKRLTTPTLDSATRSSSGVTVKWGKVTGADGYYVYRKTVGSGWTKVGTIKKGTTVSFVDKSAKTGTTYYYTVKAYSGSNTSAYNTGGIKCK